MVWFAQLPSGAAECITAAQFTYFLQFCKVALPPVSYPGHMRAQGSGNYSTCALLIQLGKVGHMCQSQFANQVQLAFKWGLSSPMFPAAPRWRLLAFWVLSCPAGLCTTNWLIWVQSPVDTLLLDRISHSLTLRLDFWGPIWGEVPQWIECNS